MFCVLGHGGPLQLIFWNLLCGVKTLEEKIQWSFKELFVEQRLIYYYRWSLSSEEITLSSELEKVFRGEYICEYKDLCLPAFCN